MSVATSQDSQTLSQIQRLAAHGRLLGSDDTLSGCRLIRDVDQTCCSSCKNVNCLCLPAFSRKPIKTIMFSDTSRNLWWPEGGRFVIHDISTSDTTKTPRNMLRRSVRCMAHSCIHGTEYIWTGHRWGEVCVWNESGRLVAKLLKAFKSCVRAICMVSPGKAWVGGDSGNIREIELHLNREPAELKVVSTLAPSLCPVGRVHSSSHWRRPAPLPPRPQNMMEHVPEDGELTSSGTDPTKSCRMVNRSTSSFVEKMSDAVRNIQWNHRAHRSHIRCIFAKGGRVWSSGGRVWYLGTIKMWSEKEHTLIGKFLCESRGPCSCFSSIPWSTGRMGSNDVDTQDWRLLTAHDSGKLLLWDPGLKSLQPLLEIEFRKSPIRSLVVWESLGLMCTAHRDGSIHTARLPTPQIRSLTYPIPVDHEDQIYPFVPRTIAELPHPSGLRCATGGYDSLYTVSDRGRILYWSKDRLDANLRELKSSSFKSQQAHIVKEVINESVKIIDRDDLTIGETIWDGDFATVRKGKFLAKDVIIKEANSKADSKKAMRALVKDAGILATLRHPNIVNIMAVCANPPLFVMQYYEEGSLYEVLKHARRDPRLRRRLTVEKRLTLTTEVACGMHFLHSQKDRPILHRDLKSPNVFVQRDYISACIGDFNLSRDKPSMNLLSIASSARPSNPMWLAPEIAKGLSDFTIASDIYSFGIIMWEVLTGRSPWDHLQPEKGKRIPKEGFYSKIRYELYGGRRPPVERLPDGSLADLHLGRFPQAESYVSLMTECWADNPEDRPRSFEVIVYRLDAIRKELLGKSSVSSNSSSPGTVGNVPKPNSKQKGPKDSEKVAEAYPGTSSDHEKVRTSEISHVVSDDLTREQAREDEIGSHPRQSPTALNFLDRPLGPRWVDEEKKGGMNEHSRAGFTGSSYRNLDCIEDTPAGNISRRVYGEVPHTLVVAPPLPTSPFDMPSNQEVVIRSGSD